MLAEDKKRGLWIIISETFNIPLDSIHEDLSMDNADSWDSFNHLLLISEIEKKLLIKFTVDEIQKIRTVRQLIEKMEHYE